MTKFLFLLLPCFIVSVKAFSQTATSTEMDSTWTFGIGFQLSNVSGVPLASQNLFLVSWQTSERNALTYRIEMTAGASDVSTKDKFDNITVGSFSLGGAAYVRWHLHAALDHIYFSMGAKGLVTTTTSDQGFPFSMTRTRSLSILVGPEYAFDPKQQHLCIAGFVSIDGDIKDQFQKDGYTMNIYTTTGIVLRYYFL